jgi:hypothetical protein
LRCKDSAYLLTMQTLPVIFLKKMRILCRKAEKKHF